MNRNRNLQIFTNETKTTDVAPALSIDFTSRLAASIKKLQELLGVAELENASSVKVYKMTQVNTPDQVAEGVEIPLTEIKRELVDTYEVTLKKYRKQTTAEAIVKAGKDVAVNKTDEKLVLGVQKSIKAGMVGTFGEYAQDNSAGKVTKDTLQKALASAWGKVNDKFDEYDATPIFFVKSELVEDYLGTAQITLQNEFGWNYIENFLGLGTTVIVPGLNIDGFATAKENINGAFVSASSSDLADSFGLVSDETGLVGMTHHVKSDNASIDTLVLSGVVFYPEFADGVFEFEVSAEEESDQT